MIREAQGVAVEKRGGFHRNYERPWRTLDRELGRTWERFSLGSWNNSFIIVSWVDGHDKEENKDEGKGYGYKCTLK